MDLSTTYLGLKLRNPLMPGASPLTDDLDRSQRLVDAGAAALVLHSLFQEQLEREGGGKAAATPAGFGPQPHEFPCSPNGYLEQIRKLKTLGVPLVASLNGTHAAPWTRSARLLQEAGADALELNVYYLGANARETGAEVERRALEIVRSVKDGVSIPVAVKLLPFYSSLANFAAQLDDAGADGVVLFNRVYQPEIDAELLEFASANVQLTDHSELALRLHWLSALSGRVRCSLAASGGVQSGVDVAKALMAGAHAVQVVSALLRKGPENLRAMLGELDTWMKQHNFDSVERLCGGMNLQRCPDPGAYERTNYMRVLQGWRG